MSYSTHDEPSIPCWFDPAFFTNSYLDNTSNVDPAEAYKSYLERETEVNLYPSVQMYLEANPQELPRSLQPYLNQIAHSFDWLGYASRNQDLSGLKPIDLLNHFLHYGLTEPRHWNPKASLLDRRFSWTAQSGSHAHLENRFQAIVHCYHFDVLCNLMSYLRTIARLGGTIHILVANDDISSSAMDDFLQRLRTGARRHSWRRVFNFGEDWSSFDHAFREGLFDEDGVTIKMQTKKSSNLGADGGLAWIDEALAPICGSYLAVERLLTHLAKDQISVQASQLTKRFGFGANEELVAAFAVQLGLVPNQETRSLPFSGGSMFAARNQVLREFFSALGPVDYSEKHSSSPYCGRYVGHALERLFFYFCQSRYTAKSIDWVL
jgi:hypothetical protein